MRLAKSTVQSRTMQHVAMTIGISYIAGSLVMNGDLTDVESVEVYDMAGKMIARSFGGNTIAVGNVDGGVVTVVIRKADSSSSAKILVK